MKPVTSNRVSSEDQEENFISTKKQRQLLRYARNKGLTIESCYLLKEPERVIDSILNEVLLAEEPIILIVPYLLALNLHIRTVFTLNKLCKQGKLEIYSLQDDLFNKKGQKHPRLLDRHLDNRFTPEFICVCKRTKKQHSNSR